MVVMYIDSQENKTKQNIIDDDFNNKHVFPILLELQEWGSEEFSVW